MALALTPRLLLMDEPTAGMTPRSRRDLMELATGLAERDNVAVLFTEHDMDIVFGFADRVLVLDRGALIAQGRPPTSRPIRASRLSTSASTSRSHIDNPEVGHRKCRWLRITRPDGPHPTIRLALVGDRPYLRCKAM